MHIHPDVATVVGKIDFDPDALHAKYLAERDKRLRRRRQSTSMSR